MTLKLGLILCLSMSQIGPRERKICCGHDDIGIPTKYAADMMTGRPTKYASEMMIGIPTKYSAEMMILGRPTKYAVDTMTGRPTTLADRLFNIQPRKLGPKPSYLQPPRAVCMVM